MINICVDMNIFAEYILSKCDGLISPMSGATRMALIMKEEKYLPEIVLNYGLY